MPHRVIAALGLLLAPAARGQQAGTPFAWTEPAPEEQLLRDRTEIPVGQGALFVPSLTGPLNEPPVILVDASSEVRDIPTGQRVLLPPGSYTVIVSSGSPEQGVGMAVEVREGETSMVPVRWGALRVEVVDDRRVPHRGGYELIRSDQRQTVGTGFGADTFAGESLQTWLLPPGVYRIVKPGANYRALRDFATVYVPEGGFVRYRLVLDPDTGEFQGSGVLLPDEFGSPNERGDRWRTNLVLGLDGSLAQQQNVVGTPNQLTLAGAAFLDGQLAYNVKKHAASLLLQGEAGASRIDPQEGDPLPVVKTRDSLRADGLYTYFVRPWIGPYTRLSGQTQMFDTFVVVTEDTTLNRAFSDGSSVTQTVLAGDSYFVADAFDPTILREGAGLNTRFVNNRWVTLNWRVGLGLKQNQYGGAWGVQDDPTTPGVELVQQESFAQEGLESTVIATARLPGWAVYATNLELFVDVADPENPSVEWRNTLTLRLTRNLSANWLFSLQSLPQVSDQAQLQQSVFLRASWALL